MDDGSRQRAKGGGLRRVPIRIAHAVGWLLTAASFVFLIRRFWLGKSGFDSALGAQVLFPLAVAALIALIGGAATIYSWRSILYFHGGPPLGFTQAFKLYAGTQIAKYIPGNIFQYAGRQVEGWKLGIAQGTMALTSVGEAGGLCCVSAAAALAGLVWSGEAAVVPGCIGWVACLAAFPLSQSLLRRLSKWFPSLIPSPSGEALPRGWKVVLKAFLGQVLFVAASAVTLSLCASPFGSAPSGRLLTACSTAWLAGFVTPGAPAGLGIREAILVMTLEGPLGRNEALAAAMLFRVAWTIADVGLYIATLFVRRLPANIKTSPDG